MSLTGEVRGAVEFQREVDRVLQGLKFKSVKPTSPHFMPGTDLPCRVQNYWLGGQGIGDRICQLPALVYVAKECPWILGRVWVPEFLLELFKNVIDQAGNPDWKILPIEKIADLYEDNTAIRGRGFKYDDGREQIQYTNGTGGHLTWVGFMDTMNKFPPPDGADIMPTINFDAWSGRHNLLHKKYVVLATGAVSRSREVPGEYWNPIIEHVKSKGLTPVFLGAHQVPVPSANINLNIRYADGCHYGEGIDLRDKTTLMEAAWIMKNAACVVGLDNGLIQLASLTDANIICAYNIVEPKDRRPTRKAGKWIELFPNKKELACAGCQTNMPLISPPHDFKTCLYGHLNCIHLLFKNQSEHFRKSIDSILA